MYIENGRCTEKGDRCAERSIDEQREGKTHRQKNRCTERRIDIQTRVESDKNMDRQKNEWGNKKMS
jgi:hypothetical protein